MYVHTGGLSICYCGGCLDDGDVMINKRRHTAKVIGDSRMHHASHVTVTRRSQLEPGGVQQEQSPALEMRRIKNTRTIR